MCEIIERVPNLTVLAGLKPKKCFCQPTMAPNIFHKFYTPFQNETKTLATPLLITASFNNCNLQLTLSFEIASFQRKFTITMPFQK